ncbi:lipase [Stenotrophomonas sp. GZD-301]|uniref:lipase n=1 Tax=Stenotrophomonas sp. GZD-301 TaxID=3404814 RepID=UPI003BB79FA8
MLKQTRPSPRSRSGRRCVARGLLAAALALPLTAAALPGVPGTVVDAEPYTAAWLPSKAATAYRLTYTTTNVHARPALSTGLVYLPAGRAPAGGWPVVSWAHGTQGVSDRCAPSVSGPQRPERDGRFLDLFLATGHAVVASDYQGLGSPGEHAFLHGATAGRNIVDMVKAAHAFARRLPSGQQLSTRWVSVGHSQGAAAAVVAGHQASTQGQAALNYRGTFGTGTPVGVDASAALMEPDNLIPYPGPINAYHAYMLLGLLQIEPAIDTVLTDAGRQRLALGRQLCLAELATALEGATTGEMFQAPLLSVPGIAPLLTTYFDMPLRGFAQPLMLAHGKDDHDVSYDKALLYAAELALQEQPVLFRPYPTDHWGILDAASPDGLAFVTSRLSAAQAGRQGDVDAAAESAHLQRLLDEAAR